jgi:hypothetical protein
VIIKLGKALLVLAVLALVGAQLVRPDRTNPPEDPARTLEAALAPPPEVSAILARACADCHSSRTRWPWYTNVAPLSWWIADHIKDGRVEVSFSEWATYSPRKQAHKLEEMCEQVQQGGMPLGSYTLVHRDAKLSPADVKLLCEWTGRMRAKLSGAPSAAPADAATPRKPM